VSDIVAGLVAALAAAPRLDGALCKGKAAQFDEAAPGEPDNKVAARHQAAIEMCNRCPAFDACAAYFRSLPPAKRPPGVIAGRVHHWHTTTRRRKESA
jgi:hypothetical protein